MIRGLVPTEATETEIKLVKLNIIAKKLIRASTYFPSNSFLLLPLPQRNGTKPKKRSRASTRLDPISLLTTFPRFFPYLRWMEIGRVIFGLFCFLQYLRAVFFLDETTLIAEEATVGFSRFISPLFLGNFKVALNETSPPPSTLPSPLDKKKKERE